MFHISTDAVRLLRTDGHPQQENAEMIFQERLDYQYKGQLERFYDEQIHGISTATCTVSWAGIRSTLVPVSVFNESNAVDIFRLCFGEGFQKSELDYNRIPELGLVNVYDIPLWVKSFFIRRLPQSIILHEGSFATRKILQYAQSAVQIYVIVNGEHFLLLCSRSNRLEYYNAFTYQHADDIVYYLCFMIQQKELSDNSGNIFFAKGNGAKESIFQECLNSVKRISTLQHFEVKRDDDILPQAHSLCV
jgi:hypothetical protein